jgi:hypothetical protein
MLRALGLSLLFASSAAADEGASRLLLELEAPLPGAVIGDPQGLVFVAGRALAVRGAYRSFEIVFAIDTSRSTFEPSGADVDGDGRILEREQRVIGGIFGGMVPRSDDERGDTILAAEVQAVRTLLAQLDPRSTRVGLVSFAGDGDPRTADALTETPLTADYAKLDGALAGILRRGPKGQTNMVDAMDRALGELLRDENAGGRRDGSAGGRSRADVRRIIVFMTDGQPTLPIESGPLQNARLAIESARRARQLDVRVDTYALGPEALEEPLVAVEMALVTGGIFTPVVRPADLETVFEGISFSDIARLELTNRTSGAAPAQLARNADGSFAALLQLQQGPNAIELYARAADGSEGRREIQVTWTPGAAAQALDADQLAAKNRLLENRLLELERANLDAEAQRDERIRAALREEIERERRKAEQKAARARKRLDIEGEN